MMGLELKDELIDKYELKNILACEEQTKEVMRLKFYTEKARDLSTELCWKVKDMPEFLKNPQKWYKVTIDSTNNVHVDRIPYETTTWSVVKEWDDIPTEQWIEEPIAQEESDAPSYTVPE